MPSHPHSTLLIGEKRRSEKTQPEVVARLGPFHVPQIYGSAMDSATSVDDAALPRSRPMLTTLTEQAEMFTSQVPISSSCLRMRICKSYIKFFPLLWILVWQITNTSCASLGRQNYSLKSFNLSVIQKNLTTPKNLSELIEFSPFNFPLELENSTVFHQDEKGDTSKIITLKLKTHVFVENNNNQTGFHEANDIIKSTKPNASDPLSEIEYLDTEQSENYGFLKWNLRSRAARMNSFDEKTDDDDDDNSNEESRNSSEEDNSFENTLVSKDSEENKISKAVQRSKYATGRQFVFHPYLPYGKDVAPDEKISFHDILPVKMVKFVKSMVEEADWNGMFKSMVRTVVDHFVNKIIEKMFTEKKDDHDGFKKRSLDVVLTPAFVLPDFQTPLVRLKRSLSTSNPPDQDEDIFSYIPSKRVPQEIDEQGKKSADERKSWLDHFLDFVFPNSKSDESDDETFDRLKKRDTTNGQLFKTLVALFLNTFEKSSEFLSDAKDVLRYKMLKDFLPYLYKKRYMNISRNITSNFIDEMKMTHRKVTTDILKRNDILDNISGTSIRHKRSTNDDFLKDEESRLWQSHSRRHRPHSHRSRDDCSLRRACNAGRLLSRLPSVQDITLQLSNGNEPHWDALIWGMKRKHCSRIFCKRQRSPKGSKYSWNSDKERLSKKVEFLTEPPAVWDETHNSTD